MRIAVTGGTGFVGGHLAEALSRSGHEAVVVSRGIDSRPWAQQVLRLPGVTLVPTSIQDQQGLARALAGCDGVAHCAGINREIGTQTYDAVLVRGTANVVQTAEEAGARRLALLSFLRVRPQCGSPYHESKWAAEELVRASSLERTILKPGMMFGRGDHMLDHLSHALHTFPVSSASGLVGCDRWLSEMPSRSLRRRLWADGFHTRRWLWSAPPSSASTIRHASLDRSSGGGARSLPHPPGFTTSWLGWRSG
ncbi:MAG: NAD(P)H-binding protein [Actinomycetota bacterium]|nr:NAD(P)H-binding protein [Actinomycetota bacterium]